VFFLKKKFRVVYGIFLFSVRPHFFVHTGFGLIIIISILCVSALCISPGIMRADPPAPDPSPSSGSGSPVSEPLIATGRGHPPASPGSKAKQRLMAKRAAMLEAYKNMVKQTGGVTSRPAGGTGYERAAGFLKGARLVETRYYQNGEVEVDIELPGTLCRKWEMFSAAPEEDREEHNAELISGEKGGGKISETEWHEVLGQHNVSPP